MVRFNSLVFLALCCFISAGYGRVYEEEWSKDLAFARGKTLIVENVNGSIQVVSHDRERCVINATKSVRALSELRAKEIFKKTEIEVAELGDTVRVRLLIPSRKDVSVGLKITVPSSATAILRNKNGAVDVADINGSVDIKTGNGSIECDKVIGRLVCRSTNGRIDLRDVEGKISAETVNGEIDCVVKGLDQDHIASFITENGSVSLSIPASLKPVIWANTENGKVWSAFDLVGNEAAIEERTGVKIKTETTNGNIRIKDLKP